MLDNQWFFLVYWNTNTIKLNLLSILSALIFTYNILNELPLYNKMYMNLAENSLIVVPNFAIRLFYSKKIISLHKIKSIYYKDFGVLFRF